MTSSKQLFITKDVVTMTCCCSGVNASISLLYRKYNIIVFICCTHVLFCRPQPFFKSPLPVSRRGGVPNRGFPGTRGGGAPKMSNGRGAAFSRGRINANRSRGRGAAKQPGPSNNASASSKPQVNKTQNFDKDEFE